MRTTDLITVQLIEQATAHRRIQELEAANKELPAIADNTALILAMHDIADLRACLAQQKIALEIERAWSEKRAVEFEQERAALQRAADHYLSQAMRLADDLEAAKAEIARLDARNHQLRNRNHEERNRYSVEIGYLQLYLEEAQEEIGRLKAELAKVQSEGV